MFLSRDSSLCPVSDNAAPSVSRTQLFLCLKLISGSGHSAHAHSIHNGTNVRCALLLRHLSRIQISTLDRVFPLLDLEPSAKMTSYFTVLWRSFTGVRANDSDSADFLDALRPRRVLSTPRRLPTTPTRSHLPARRSEPKDRGKKSKQCPHCRKTFYLELPAGRISKPLKQRSGRKRKEKKWVSVRDRFRVDDMSPGLESYQEDDGEAMERAGVGKAKGGKRKSTTIRKR